MNELVIGLIFSIPVGIACSILAWWILFHRYAAELSFSDQIVCDPDRPNIESPIYELRVSNQGSRRAVDLDVTIRFRYKHYMNRYMNIDFPNLQARCIALGAKEHRVLHIDVNEMVQGNRQHLPVEILAKAENRTLTLSDLLNLSEAEFSVFVLASDELSGSRHLFESPKYGCDDVIEFSGREVGEVSAQDSVE